MFACLFLPPAPASSAAGHSPAAADALAAVAREFSPRVEAHGVLMTLDISGLDRLLGDGWAIGRELRRAAADRGLAAHVAVAATRSAAMLLSCGRSGLTVAPPGEERRLLADLPLSVLERLEGTEGRGTGTVATGVGRRLRASPSWTPCDAGLTSPEAVGVPDGPVPPSPTADRRPTPHGSMPSRLSPSIARLATVPPRSPQRDPVCSSAFRLTPSALSTTHYPLPAVLRRWGLRTLGELAALPPAALSERLGQDGVRWQRLARGEDAGPLVPDLPEKRYEASLDLEWPVEGLEPLSFVFARLFETLCAELVRDDRAAAVLHVAFTLTTREIETRTLQLPAPMRDPRVLRTLVLLTLEGHPVAAGIDRIEVVADPAPGRIVQGLLLGRALPVPEQLAPLLARLGALMGEARVGAAAPVDSHRPGAFQMTSFRGWGPGTRDQNVTRDELTENRTPGIVLAPGPRPLAPAVPTVLRRFRIPVPARVQVEDGAPAHVATDRAGFANGRVVRAAGPWRTSGEWWQLSDARLQVRPGGGPVQVGWNRDEWDVALGDGGIYRLYRDRHRNRWFVDGIVD